MPDQPFVLDALRIVRSELVLGRGDLDAALAILPQLADALDGRHGRIFRRTARVALARALVSGGDPVGAAAALAPVIALWDGDEEGPFMLSALLPMAAAEVAGALGDAGEAERWSGELHRLGSGPRADYVRALAELTRGAPGVCPVVEVSARAVGADGRRWEAAWMRLSGARAAERAGEVEGAVDLAAAALDGFREMASEGWCRVCEALLRRLGQRVPGRRTPRGPGGLTIREVEVLRLIADGCPNRVIAQRLVISEGTAGRHVSNVYAKLGAHSRLEAARIASERGLLD